jgi:transposase
MTTSRLARPQAREDEGIIRCPSDPEAQTGKKRDQTWLGYTVHFTQTCAMPESEPEQATPLPQLMVQVQTTVAPVPDVEMTATIHEELAKGDLLPEEHLVATGYVDADLLVSSQQKHGIK